MKHMPCLAGLSALIVAASFSAATYAYAQNSSVHVKTLPKPQAETVAPAAPEQPETDNVEQQKGNPVGVSPGWNANISDVPPQASEYADAPDQAEILNKVNAYFNDMKNLEGRFLQTDPDAKTKKGYFYLQRPGKVRFDYARPSLQKIISDGEYLAIEDHDLKTADRYPLDSTPFRLLLKDKVDLANDAQIIALDIGENIVVITLEDRRNRGRGQIRLFFEWPEVKLTEWIITDAQGLDTRIQLSELKQDKEADPKLFKFTESIGLPDFINGNR